MLTRLTTLQSSLKLKMSSIAFNSDGAELISRQLETELTLETTGRSREELEAFYELERCSVFITDHNYHRVNTLL